METVFNALIDSISRIIHATRLVYSVRNTIPLQVTAQIAIQGSSLTKENVQENDLTTFNYSII